LVVLDTEEIYFQIGRQIIGQYGKTFEWSLKSRLMGMPWNEAVDLLLETLELPITREEYINHAKKMEHLFEDANLLPGVSKLIQHLRHHNVPIAVSWLSFLLEFDIFRIMIV
jgi:pseudouridine 5'-phosphatase